MNGVINVYKEAGYSSFHVIYEIRKITGEQKVGHTGTLDPQVSGVLPVCLGKATKLAGQLTDTDKTYRCKMLLGKSTDTQDATGNVIREMPLYAIRDILSDPETAKTKISEVLIRFTGNIMQIPPMYSALKVGGMKLVNAARKGIEVERKARPVTVYSIDQISVSDDLQYVSFDVKCSKGTYIRTLCHDAGEALGIPCCMYELERICACGLDKSSSITLDQIRQYNENGTLTDYLISADSFLSCYRALTVKDEIRKKIIYGNYFDMDDICESGVPLTDCGDGEIFRVYDLDREFYALYRFDGHDRKFKCVKMFRDI